MTYKVALKTYNFIFYKLSKEVLCISQKKFYLSDSNKKLCGFTIPRPIAAIAIFSESWSHFLSFAKSFWSRYFLNSAPANLQI